MTAHDLIIGELGWIHYIEIYFYHSLVPMIGVFFHLTDVGMEVSAQKCDCVIVWELSVLEEFEKIVSVILGDHFIVEGINVDERSD